MNRKEIMDKASELEGMILKTDRSSDSQAALCEEIADSFEKLAKGIRADAEYE